MSRELEKARGEQDGMMAELARARHKRDNALEEARGECERLNDVRPRPAHLMRERGNMIAELEAATGGKDIISAQHGARTRELWEARGERCNNAARDLEEANAALQTAAAIEDQLVEKMMQLSEANKETYLMEEAR